MGKQAKSTELRLLIGRRLRAARMAYEENQASFARRMGIDARLVSKYEGGGTYPDEAYVVKFCRLTGCRPDWIYLGEITQEMPSIMAARIGVLDPELVPAPAGGETVTSAAVREIA